MKTKEKKKRKLTRSRNVVSDLMESAGNVVGMGTLRTSRGRTRRHWKQSPTKDFMDPVRTGLRRLITVTTIISFFGLVLAFAVQFQIGVFSLWNLE